MKIVDAPRQALALPVEVVRVADPKDTPTGRQFEMVIGMRLVRLRFILPPGEEADEAAISFDAMVPGAGFGVIEPGQRLQMLDDEHGLPLLSRSEDGPHVRAEVVSGWWDWGVVDAT